MNLETITSDFKRKVCSEIRLEPEGVERFRVFTPFHFDDGDHLAMVLKQDGDRWILSDEGHTFMHLTYDIDERDLQKGTRQKIISNALAAFFVEDREGELQIPIPDDRYGDALYNFVQALLRISDISYLSRERVRSTFMEDFIDLMDATVPEERRAFNWSDPEHDPEGKYQVDCRVNSMARPYFIYALPSDGKVRDATISLLKFESWNIPHHSIAIFEDQEQINRKVLARFSDICEKQFSSLGANRERIARYIKEGMNFEG